MTKQEEFLWCVQTMVMLDAHNICLDLDPNDRTKISVSGRDHTIVYAIRASRHIPDNYSAEHAAFEFFNWLKFIENRGERNEVSKPHWFPESELSFDLTRRSK